MSQWPLDGQPGEDDDLPEAVEPGGTDDAIEGTVVPFPTQPGTEVEPTCSSSCTLSPSVARMRAASCSKRRGHSGS